VYGIYSALVAVKRKARRRLSRPEAADPERSTRLLWRGRRAAAAPPKAGLSLDRVVRAAVALADEAGLEAVSMRRVAERLGFTTMSLYRHVPGKGELTDLMRDAVLGEASLEAARRGDWKERLSAWARGFHDLHVRHPWLAGLGGRRVPGPSGVLHYEAGLHALQGSGLEPNEVVAAVALLGGFVESAARQSAETAEAERRSGVTDAEWWQARGSLFDRLEGYPALETIWREGGYDRPLDPFAFGLARLLEGLDALVRARARKRR
jgi:AcrR family transcriptional regulator